MCSRHDRLLREKVKAKIVADSKYNHLGFVPLKKHPFFFFLKDSGEVKFHSNILSVQDCF